MKRRIFFTIALITSSLFLFASGTENYKVYNWNNAGNNDLLTNHKQVNIWNSGCDYRGELSNNEAFNNAVAQLGEEGGIVFFKAGVYLFNESLNIPSNIIIKGEGPNTVLTFNLLNPTDAINFNGKIVSSNYELVMNAKKGSKTIYLDNTSDLKVGDLLKFSLPESELTTSEWAKGSIGQLATISAISKNQIVLESALRLDFKSNEKVLIQKIAAVKNAGISCVQIIRVDSTANQTSNIQFNYAQNCFVKGVMSDYCNFAHVEINNSYKIEVTGSYFRFGYGYGNGGRAYGTVLQFSSSDCLIENNGFNTLRHAILLQAGPNGNVIAYNYSAKTYWEETSLPSNSAGDLVLHGNYPFANLFEGNIVQNIVVDDSHGKNGPHNTFFKNTAELYGLFINPNAADSQNLIGNRITKRDFLYGNYRVYGKGHYENANYVQNKFYPNNSSEIQEASFYLPEKSDLIIQENNKKEGYRIQAESRHHNKFYTSCPAPENLSYEASRIEVQETYLSISTNRDANELSVYPNPTSDFINIDYYDNANTTLINANGQEVLTTTQKVINVSALPKGVYYLRIETPHTVLAYKKVLVN